VKKVTEAERLEIFQEIRWNLMSHEQLVECSMDEELSSAKAYILNGLSLKLVNHEKTSKLNETFNTKTRKGFEAIGHEAADFSLAELKRRATIREEDFMVNNSYHQNNMNRL
jgi:hypothetical protein